MEPHGKIQRLIELKNLGNISFHYEFRFSALHHGTQIENGHYNALIVDDYEVFLVDDEVSCDVTDGWLYRAQRPYIWHYMPRRVLHIP